MSIIICPVIDCDKSVVKRQWCESHYRFFLKYGDPNHIARPVQKHGATVKGNKDKLYAVYQSIKNRTGNPESKYYEYYGARGIVLCDGWSRSFTSFKSDIGDKPSSVHSLDRMNNDGNYSCGSCDECTLKGWPKNIRWATRRQQTLNRRKNKNNRSGYRGVYYDRGKYVARLTHNYKMVHLGRHETPESAALAYNVGALQYYGEDAVLNKLQ